MTPQEGTPAMPYRDAFMAACQEYNDFGACKSNAKIRVETYLQLRLFGLKAPILKLVFFSYHLIVG